MTGGLGPSRRFPDYLEAREYSYPITMSDNEPALDDNKDKFQVQCLCGWLTLPCRYPIGQSQK